MADFLFVEEYGEIFRDNQGNAVQGTGPVIATHKIPLGEASVPTTVPFDDRTRWIQVHADDDCYFNVGQSGVVADPTDRMLRCGHYRALDVTNSRRTHIAVLRRTD